MLRKFILLAATGAILVAGPVVAEPRTPYQAAGAWRIDGFISPSGRLSYVLATTDQASAIELEFHCQPAEGANAGDGAGMRILGPFWKELWPAFTLRVDTVFVSYSVDGAPPDQIKGSIFFGKEIAFPREAIGVGRVMNGLKKARTSLLLSIRDYKGALDVRGFRHLEPIWERLCIGGGVHQASPWSTEATISIAK